MAGAIGSAVIVLVSGYFGCILGEAGCIMATAAAATGCIVYAIGKQRRDKE